MSIGGFDPDFSIIERGYDQPPDEPHPRRVLTCPECGSDDLRWEDFRQPSDPAYKGIVYCDDCQHRWKP